MKDLKAGLDHRAYDFVKIDTEKGPLWRSHTCEPHGGGYEDIVALMETTSNVERMFRPCCMEPYNDAAFERLAYWRSLRDTAAGRMLMLEQDQAAANLLLKISSERRKTPLPDNLIEETMAAAKMVGGATWPSADMTRWALERLASRIANHVVEMWEMRKGPNVMRDQILLSCGLFGKPKI